MRFIIMQSYLSQFIQWVRSWLVPMILAALFWILLGWIVCALIGFFDPSVRAAEIPFERPATADLLLKHRINDGHDNERAALHRQNGAKEIVRYHNINWTLIRFPEHGNNKHQLRQAYRESGLFEVVQTPMVYSVGQRGTLTANPVTPAPQFVPNDPLWPQQWGPMKIQSPLAWDKFTGSNNVVVAVIDTGIDYTHSDLRDNMWTGPNGEHGYTALNGVIGAGGFDDHYHGTHVAGTIGAVGNNGIGVVGLNWKIQLIALKFITSAGSGSTADAVLCIDKMIDLVHSGVPIRVSNNSWGGEGYDQALYDAFRAAQDAGVVNICAAGNSGEDIGVNPFSPASFDLDGIVVAIATDQGDAKAYFSNYGWPTDIAAPGVSILSTQPGDRYQSLSGTSMASPHLAGVAAGLFALNPSLSVIAARNILLDPGSYDQTSFTFTSTGGGRINQAKCWSNPLIGHPPTNVNHAPMITLNTTNAVQVVPVGQSFTLIGTVVDPDGDNVTATASLTSEQNIVDSLPRRLLGPFYTTNVQGSSLTVFGQPLAVDIAPIGSISAVDGRGGGTSKGQRFFVYRDPTKIRDLKKAILGFTASYNLDTSFIATRLTVDTNIAPASELSYAVTIFRKDIDFAETYLLPVNVDSGFYARLENPGVNSCRAQLMDIYGNFGQTDPPVLIDLGNTGAKPPLLRPVFSVIRGAVPYVITCDMTASANIPSGTMFMPTIWKSWGASVDTLNPIQKFQLNSMGTWFIGMQAVNTNNHTGDYWIQPVNGLPVDSTQPPSTNPPPPSLTAPVNLVATDGGGRVLLSWQDTSSGETLYKVVESVKSQGGWRDIATVNLPANATTYSTAAARGVYQFKVSACVTNACGPSAGAEIRVR